MVTDVIMPEMNGRELVERLTRSSSKLKALFVSGYPAEVISRRGVLDTDVHFLQKPFTMKTLATSVRNALES